MVSELPALEFLDLSTHPKITVAYLTHLQGAKALRVLNLADTAVPYRGLEHLIHEPGENVR